MLPGRYVTVRYECDHCFYAPRWTGNGYRLDWCYSKGNHPLHLSVDRVNWDKVRFYSRLLCDPGKCKDMGSNHSFLVRIVAGGYCRCRREMLMRWMSARDPVVRRSSSIKPVARCWLHFAAGVILFSSSPITHVTPSSKSDFNNISSFQFTNALIVNDQFVTMREWLFIIRLQLICSVIVFIGFKT